jgi:RNA polymerase sigma-70 factor (ECF subfamily)
MGQEGQALVQEPPVGLTGHRHSASGHPLERAVQDHGALLACIARRLCRNTCDADDLVHDTYERALRGWHLYSDRRCVRAWLVAILQHRFIDRCRRARRRPPLAAIDDVKDADLVAAEPEPPARASIPPEMLEAALATLGDEFRRDYEHRARGRSYDEIAAELGIAKGTVGTRLIRARERIRDALAVETEGRRTPRRRTSRPRRPASSRAPAAPQLALQGA